MDYLSFDAASSDLSADAGEQLLDELDRVIPLDLDLSDDQATATTTMIRTPGDERRRRHREGMARLRSQRRARIQQLETQAKTLHHRLRHAIAWMDRHRADHQTNDCRCLAYVELVTAAEALLQERYTLEDELHFHQRYARLVVNEGVRLEEETKVSDALLDTTHESEGYWVRYADDELPLFYDYEAADACATTIQRGLDDVASVRRALSQPSDQVMSTHCLGWHVEHLVTIPNHSDHASKPVLQYRFTRLVASVQTTLEELGDRTWTTLSTSQLLAKMYGSTVVAKVVQMVSDDAFILLRNSPVRTRHTRFRYFSLVSRLRSSESRSLAIIKVMLPKEPRQVQLEQRHGITTLRNEPHEPAVVWLHAGVSCFHFTERDDDTIGIEHVGFIECVDDSHARHLVTETCLSLLRWEQCVVPPRMLTQS